MFEKLRAFADIGRTQGITTTASIAIVGGLTSTVSVQWYHIVYFTILATISHMALNTYIALGDIELDAHTYVPSRNPVSSGILSRKEAMFFVFAGTLVCLFLIPVLWFVDNLLSILMMFLCFIPAYRSCCGTVGEEKNISSPMISPFQYPIRFSSYSAYSRLVDYHQYIPGFLSGSSFLRRPHSPNGRMA